MGFHQWQNVKFLTFTISVSGIGANTARTMLSSLTPKQVREGIASW